MKIFTRALFSCLLVSIAGTASASLIKADFISGVTVSSTTPDYHPDWAVKSITDNSGMSDILDAGSPNASHVASNSNQWVTQGGHPTGVVDFTLPGTFGLSHLVWWNGHQGHATNRGANLVNIMTSIGGGLFSDLGNFNIAQATGTAPDTIIDLSSLMPVADLVRISILSNHGDNNYLTIREIRFYEGSAYEGAAAVPEPDTLALMALAALGLLVRSRKLNK
ncbi:MAG: hypothetical protein ACI965_002165 [Paraglaciecola sp.]|jgi:hypothetical protein